MKIKTRKFGEVEIADEKILTMPLGLAGFPGKKQFVLFERKETRPFCWFQSAEDANLALIVMNPLLIQPDYKVDLRPVIKELGWDGLRSADTAVYVVLTLYDDGPYLVTANMIGPIVINTQKREAAQVVMYDSPYSVQHPVVDNYNDPPHKKAVGG